MRLEGTKNRQRAFHHINGLLQELIILMQMPAGTGTFETVPEQLEILRLEQ